MAQSPSQLACILREQTTFEVPRPGRPACSVCSGTALGPGVGCTAPSPRSPTEISQWLCIPPSSLGSPPRSCSLPLRGTFCSPPALGLRLWVTKSSNTWTLREATLKP